MTTRHITGLLVVMAQPASTAQPEVVPATQHEVEESKWSNFETVFTNAKAGMAGVDKEHVKRIVYEMSKVRQGVHMTPHTCQVLEYAVPSHRILRISRMSSASRHRQSSASRS